jgi:hypothetical protein
MSNARPEGRALGTDCSEPEDRRNTNSAAAAATHRKTDRTHSSARPTLREPIIVAEWWKNRSGVAIRLSTYEGHNLVDVRSWFTGDDGKLKPGKGFAASIKHLPRLAAEITKALRKAAELGLVDVEAGTP